MYKTISTTLLKEAQLFGDVFELFEENQGHFRMTGFIAIPTMDWREDFDQSWSPLGEALLEYSEGSKDLESIAFDFFLCKCSLFIEEHNAPKIKLIQTTGTLHDIEGIAVFSFAGTCNGFRIDGLVCVDNGYHEYT